VIPAAPRPRHYPDVPLTRMQAVKRALADVGHGIYGFGEGGRNPAGDRETWSELLGKYAADCSGSLLYWLGLDRHQPKSRFPLYGGWISTDSMIDDAELRGGGHLFARVATPRPGDVLVWPGVDLDRDGDRDRIGHCSIIVSVPAEWDEFDVTPQYDQLRVVQCRGPNGNTPAVVETSGAPWMGRETIVKKGKPYGTDRDWRTRILRPLHYLDSDS
jgi:hypothetical protein